MKKTQTPYQRRFQKLCSKIAKAEGKKRQVRIGDIREIVRIIVHMEWKAARCVGEFFTISELDELVRTYNPEPKKKKRVRG